MKTKNLLYTSLIILVILVLFFFMPLGFQRNMFVVLAVLGVIFLAFGVWLLIRTRKMKKGKLKNYLIITGCAMIAPLVFAILHNLFYGLGIMLENILWLKYIVEVLSAGFFIIALIVAPITFLVFAIFSLKKL